MKIAIQDAILKLTLNILKGFKIFPITCHFYQKEQRLKSVTSSSAICTIKKLCHTHKNFKTSIKSWINQLKKVQKVIKFNQEKWLMLYTDINTKLKTGAKK